MALPVLEDRDFSNLLRIIYALTGVTMDEGKRSLVRSRVARRLRAHGLSDVQEYVRLLEGPTREEQEIAAFIDTLTTHKTSFFRTRSIWSFLEKEVTERFQRNEDVRIWSCASSSGEEPYSLAMLLQTYCGSRSWEVTASDVSPLMVEKTKTGQFDPTTFPDAEQAPGKVDPISFFEPASGLLQASRKLRDRMKFQVHNLLHPMSGSFAIIMLRNVIIYFSDEDRETVIANALRALRPEGLLILGESESLCSNKDKLQFEAPCIYRRKK